MAEFCVERLVERKTQGDKGWDMGFEKSFKIRPLKAKKGE